jgi:hypothetical protein
MAASSDYLVTHGCTAALTRCRAGSHLLAQHGDQVVIESPRGLELGEVLCPAGAEVTVTSIGQVLRLATPEDEQRAHDLRCRGQLLLDDSQQLIDEMQLPLLPLDVDMILDGDKAILHVLRWQSCTLTPFIEQLRARQGLQVTLFDRSKVEETHEHGCGSCGAGGCGSCGDEGCGSGCSSGDCSRGKIQSAEELTRYFAALRAQMQAHERVPLL